MSLRVGIVGLPNVGKSTLFNALLKKRVALSANYPFATIEPNVGVVAVSDLRLEKLSGLVQREEGMEKLPPIIYATVEFVDIAGLVKGASTGAGLGNQFLSHIREVDAIIHVLRDFSDPDIIREGSVEPESDKEVVETELALADLETIEKLISSAEKGLKFSKDVLDPKRLEILKKIKEGLDKGVYGDKLIKISESIDKRLQDWIINLPLLSIKPVFYVYNVSEDSYTQKVLGREYNGNELVISAKLEEELTDLSEEERKEYLKELGLSETGLERLIKKAYALLGLISFLTAGKKEVRAWTIKTGTKASQAAGVIHTDFEKKFIRAEVIEYKKLVEAESFAKAKEKGWLRTEGRDYQMQDGDVVEFLVGS